MKLILQDDEDNGCGVACVAMIAGVDYAEARKVIYPNGRSRLTKTRDLHDALIYFRRKPLADRRQPRGSRQIEDLDCDALVFVEIADRYKAKHWMVWDSRAKQLLDPLGGKRKVRFLGYLPVG